MKRKWWPHLLPNRDADRVIVLFFSRHRSQGWPHHGRTFSTYLCLLLLWLTLPQGRAPDTIFFALSLSPQLPCFLVVTALGKLLTSIVHLFTNTHAHPFNVPFSGTTRVSRYQKGKTNLDFAEARHSEQRHMQVCNSLQTDNHVSTPPLQFFYRPDALPAAQRRASKHWRHKFTKQEAK